MDTDPLIPSRNADSKEGDPLNGPHTKYGALNEPSQQPGRLVKVQIYQPNKPRPLFTISQNKDPLPNVTVYIIIAAASCVCNLPFGAVALLAAVKAKYADNATQARALAYMSVFISLWGIGVSLFVWIPLFMGYPAEEILYGAVACGVVFMLPWMTLFMMLIIFMTVHFKSNWISQI